MHGSLADRRAVRTKMLAEKNGVAWDPVGVPGSKMSGGIERLRVRGRAGETGLNEEKVDTHSLALLYVPALSVSPSNGPRRPTHAHKMECWPYGCP
jgi:hypothetical protein